MRYWDQKCLMTDTSLKNIHQWMTKQRPVHTTDWQ